MERLTRRYDTHIAVVCENCDKQLECNGGVICGEVLRNRLAAYEDAMPLERAQELAQAEKDRRLVVLPCSERLEYYGSESRKISADEYWDDHAVHMPAPPNNPLTLDELMEMDEPVWCRVDNCEWIPDGGYYCLCNKGKITTPAGIQYRCDTLDFTLWRLYRRKPEEETV